MTRSDRDINRQQLVIATSNPGKMREFRAILPASVDLLSLADLGLDSPEETGRTFLENAVLKAEYASRASGLSVIADDSGLEVDALSGRPGVLSARYAGPGSTDAANNRKLVRELAQLPSAERSARFVCAVAFRSPEGLQLTAEAAVAGEIIDEPRGSNGFGYDPYFLLTDPGTKACNGRTMAEIDLHEKSQVSHRRMAIDRLIHRAQKQLASQPALGILTGNNQGIVHK